MKRISNNEINKDSWLEGEATPQLNIKVKRYNLKELCNLYDMTYYTMNANLRPLKKLLGERKGYSYNIRQVQIIFRELGLPFVLKEIP
jgi:hypothetical protein